MKILIIGNGIAGLSAAEEIRKKNKEVDIQIITKEKYHTYYRTQLSHFLSKDFKVEDIYVKPEKWYRENNIKVHLNIEVISINKDNKRVKLSNNQELTYDKLLIANGAHSFIPPIDGNDKEGVFSLRYFNDLQKIQKYASRIDKGIVIGGGLLGLEAANSLNKLGIETLVIEYFDRLLPRQLDQEGSELLMNIVQEQGVKLLLGSQVESIYGDEGVQGCNTKEGEQIDTSLVLFSTGVRPNIRLAKEMGLLVNKSIMVDKFMNTSEKDIYAAGDVCEFEGNSPAIWTVAIEQGKVAGSNMIGEEREYKTIIPSNMLDIMGSKVFSIGDIGLEDNKEYQILREKDEDKNKLKKLFFLNGKLVGAILINDINMAGKLKKLISLGEDYAEIGGLLRGQT